ncbi:MAG TPA: RNA polymerase sigma factor [Polyangia bacterium]|nr:RNA polymerase sigma factor [Polyangia bacterium]
MDHAAVDADLLRGLREGDADALAAAYAAHAPNVLRFLVRLTGRRDLAEDLFQETWVRLARHARRLEADTNLRAWLLTVARNLHRDHARWAGLDGERLEALARWWYLDASDRQAPESAAIAADVGARVERAMAQLPTSAREILSLVAGEGLAVEDAARALGLTPEAARQRLHRARAALAEILNRQEKTP